MCFLQDSNQDKPSDILIAELIKLNIESKVVTNITPWETSTDLIIPTKESWSLALQKSNVAGPKEH